MLSLSKENVFLTEVFMQKKVSVKDIAEELNISLSTVHKALTGKGGISEARRKEVLDMAKRMGYDLNWGNVDKEELLEASILSVDNYKVLIGILESCVD